MAIIFPDPNDTTEFEHITNSGSTITYNWDGEKWVSIDISGGFAQFTDEIILRNPDGIDDFNGLNQAQANSYIYDRLENIDGEVYSPTT
jgi:hypothetical protein